MTRIITSSIVRDARPDESHGGVFVVDPERQEVRQVIDVQAPEDDEVATEDLGVRGIAIDGETIYLVTGDELLAYSAEFELTASWRCPYLKHADEVSIHQRKLYIVSSGYDSILAFDLDQKQFVWALHVDLDRFSFEGSAYDPMGEDGPLRLNKLKLNSVHANDDGMYIAGLQSAGLLHFNGEAIYMAVTLPDGACNAQPFRDGVLFNDSEGGAVRYVSRSGEEDRAVAVPDVATTEDGSARNETPQRSIRGLCPINDRVVAAGSSPATLALHDLKESRTLLSVTLSDDPRHEIRGVAVWPF